MRGWKLGLAIAASLFLVVGCSCDDDSLPDGSLPDGGLDGAMMDSGERQDAGPGGRCGNGILEGAEECDDNNRDADDGCSPTCTLECGDGMVSGDELCDTAIAAGDPGACPTECDDSDPCTTDATSGTECAVECVNAPITAPVDGDGCCPTGETSMTDDDCATMCGNMLLEMGELCEDGTAMPCPTMCDDGNTCTTDTLSGSAATCDAECAFVDITMCSTTSDGCCPTGCDSTTDADCSASCGNMIFEPPAELCEDGTSMPCPTSCDDGMACTADTLTGTPSMCNVQCSNTPITMCLMTSDGCCPGTCNATNDADCTPMCGNGVMEMGEQCDDGNTMSGDGCSATCTTEMLPPTAFRFTDLDLMDPHVYAMVPFLGCTDVTNLSLFGIDGVNPLIQDSIRNDNDMMGDPGYGLLDLSVTHVFEPLVQTAGMSTPSALTFPDCTTPYGSPPPAGLMCTLPMGAPRTTATAMNMGSGATCLDIVTGTTRPYGSGPAVPVAPASGTCYVASAGTVMFNLGGIPIVLEDAAIGGEWSGTPATQITDGLIRGFMSEATADATIIPPGTTGIASIDGQPLSSLLRGGSMNCSEPAPMAGDTDMRMGVRGWWFYLNFSADAVPYTEL